MTSEPFTDPDASPDDFQLESARRQLSAAARVSILSSTLPVEFEHETVRFDYLRGIESWYEALEWLEGQSNRDEAHNLIEQHLPLFVRVMISEPTALEWERLDEHRHELWEGLSTLIGALMHTWGSPQGGPSHRQEGLVHLQSRIAEHDHLKGMHLLSQNLSAAVAAATTAATAAQTAAGHAANTTLSGEMNTLATDQLATANNFRIGAIVLSAAAALTAALLTLFAPTTDPTGLASHVVITAGIAGLAGYTGVQSSKHRRLGDWCKVLSVQLRTFNAYLEPIAEDAVKDDIRRQFAVRAFSPVADAGGSDDGGVTIAQQLIAAMPFSMREKN